MRHGNLEPPKRHLKTLPKKKRWLIRGYDGLTVFYEKEIDEWLYSEDRMQSCSRFSPQKLA